MAIENTYLLGKNITLGCGFDLQAKAPLDSRTTVATYAGLAALVNGNAAYEGMRVFVETGAEKGNYQYLNGEWKNELAELKTLIENTATAAMEFKGAATALPENPARGDMYKVTASFKVGEEDVKVGDSIVYDGEQWFVIPSGDDIEDTWRPVTDVDNASTLTFAAGDKIDVTVAANGTITYSHEEIAAPANMNAEDDEPTRTYITQLISDNHGHIIGFKTATEVVEDTNTTYEFEGLPVGEDEEAPSNVYFQVKSSDSETAEVVYVDAYTRNEANNEFAKKVDKVEGYSLVSDTEIARLADVDNYDDEEVRGLIGDNAQAIGDLEAYVGTIPTDEKYANITNVISYVNKKAEETLSAAQGGSSETAASVKQQLDNYKSENDTRVKAVEDDVAAIKNAETGILKQAQNYADSLASNYDAAGTAAGVQTTLEAEIAKKVDNDTYTADKATFAIAETVNAALELKANAADVVANDTFESFKTSNTQAIADAKAGAVSDVEAKGYAVATDVATTYATKTELGNVDAKFASYNTTAAQKQIDDAQDARIKAIEDDYLVEADIAEFETKANVKKVADDLAAYVESNDAALAAETKARTDADADFESRIADLEANFGDGEGTVEAQIAAAVKVEEDARKEAVKGVQDEVDAVEGRMDTAEGKIATLETESAKHAIKTEVESALALKADKSVVDAMYTNDQIDAAILVETNRAKGVEEGLQTQINTIMNNPDAENAINSINEFTAWVAEHGTIAEGMRKDIDQNKEDIAANTKAIEDEASRADTAEKALSGRIDTLEAIDHDAYVGADAALKAELQKEIDDDVKAAIEAEVARANAAYDATGSASAAQAAAEATAAGALATAKTEISAEIDADVKVVNDALEGYKTSNNAAVALKANSADVYAKTETYTQDEVNAAIAAAIEAAHTWGSF